MNLHANLSEREAKSIPFLMIHPGPYRGNYANIHYGLGVLAAIIENNGIPIWCRDYMADPFDRHELINLIKDNGIKIVGFSLMTPQAPWAYGLIKVLKEKFPHLIIISGGSHSTFMPKHDLEAGVDIVFRRESERSLVAVLPLLVNGMPKTEDLKKVKGLGFLEDGELVTTGNPGRVENLDMVPWPARHLFHSYPKNYPPQVSLASGYCAHIFSSRGCPELCGFCAQPYRDGVFYRSPENVVDEIEYLKNKYNISHFYINDDLFCHDNERAVAISELMIKRKINLPWVASFAYVLPVCLEMFKAMSRSGCLAVTFGVESGSPKVRQDIHKRGTLDDVQNAVTLAQKGGLMAGATFVLGNPTETFEEAEETIRFARKLNADYPAFFINCPYPGSPDYKYFTKRDLFLSNNWEDYWIQDKPILRTEQLSVDDLSYLKKKAFSHAYSSPRWWSRQLNNLFRLGDFRLGFNVAMNIIQEIYDIGHAPKEKKFTFAADDFAPAECCIPEKIPTGT